MRTIYEIHPEYKHLESFIKELPDMFESAGEVIYEARNTLKRYEVSGVSLIVKRFKYPHIINRFVYGTIRQTKARRSYDHSMTLLEKGVSVPEPVGYIEQYACGLRYSYYISVEVRHAREMREFWLIREIGDRYDILEGFGYFTAELHNRGILHHDYSSGNILFFVKNGRINFYLIDLNRMRFKKCVTEEEGYRNLRQLWLTDEAYRAIAEAYADARGFNREHAVQRVCYYKDKFMKQ